MASNRFIVLALCAGLASNCAAQDPVFFVPFGQDQLDLPKQAVFAHGSYQFGSDALYNELFLKLRNGGFIDRDMRQRSYDALTNNGRIGQQLDVGLTFWGRDSLFGTSHLQCHIAISHHSLLGVKFTKDAYALTFFGNKPFEDRTATLDGSAYEQQIFQQIGWGIMDRRNLSFLRISLVKGQTLEAIDLDQASLYTAPDGRALDAEILGAYHRSDTASSSGLGVFNGVGGALSARINRPLHIDLLGPQMSWFTFEVSDLGFIAWNKNSLHQQKDSTFNYEGVEVQDIFDLTNVSFSEDDLLDTLGIRYESGSFARAMPFRIALTLATRPGEKWSAAATVDQRYLPGYVPRGSVTAFHHFSDRGRFGVSATYGGFGAFRVGIQSESMLGNAVYLNASIPDLQGMFSAQGRGLAASLMLGAFF